MLQTILLTIEVWPKVSPRIFHGMLEEEAMPVTFHEEHRLDLWNAEHVLFTNYMFHVISFLAWRGPTHSKICAAKVWL